MECVYFSESFDTEFVFVDVFDVLCSYYIEGRLVGKCRGLFSLYDICGKGAAVMCVV